MQHVRMAITWPGATMHQSIAMYTRYVGECRQSAQPSILQTCFTSPFTFGQQRRDRLISCLGDAPKGPQEQPHHPQDPGRVQLGEERWAWGCPQQALDPGLQCLIQHACSLQCKFMTLSQQAVLCCAVLCIRNQQRCDRAKLFLKPKRQLLTNKQHQTGFSIGGGHVRRRYYPIGHSTMPLVFMLLYSWQDFGLTNLSSLTACQRVVATGSQQCASRVVLQCYLSQVLALLPGQKALQVQQIRGLQ